MSSEINVIKILVLVNFPGFIRVLSYEPYPQQPGAVFLDPMLNRLSHDKSMNMLYNEELHQL